MQGKELPKNRLAGIDAVSERLADLVAEGNLQALFLGPSSDGTPLFAVGNNHGGDRNLLAIGGGAGDSIIGITTAYRLLTENSPNGWNAWAICGLDVPRIRQNVAQLGKPSPTLEEHIRSRRMPWGPGEDPETNLPVRQECFLQPDHYPELSDLPKDLVGCSPESLALAKAIFYLKPELTVSFRESVIERVKIEASQNLSDEDIQNLYSRLQDASPEASGRDRFEQLPMLEEAEVDEQSAVYLGGIGAWQFATVCNPDALYLRFSIPRFAHPQAWDTSLSQQTRQVKTETTVRTVNNREQTVLVNYIQDPAQEDKWVETGLEIVGDEHPMQSEITQLPVTVSMLAIEAILTRQKALTSLMKQFTSAEEHLTSVHSERGIQVVQSAASNDLQLRSFKSRKEYQRPANQVDVFYWQACYQVETACLLQEALFCLEEESRIDGEVIQLRELLESTIQSCLDGVSGVLQSPVEALGAQTIANNSLEAVGYACGMVDQLGPAIIRMKNQVEKLEKMLREANIKARNSKLVGHPRAEQQQAAERAEQLELDLQNAQYQLEKLENSQAKASSEKQPTPEVPPVHSWDSSQAEASSEKQPNPEDQPSLSRDLTHSTPTNEVPLRASETSQASEATTPEVPEIEPEQPNSSQSLSGLRSGADQGTTPPPPGALPPVPEAPRLEPVVIGSPEKQEEPKQESVDIEALLPEKLEVPREWGHGSLHWENQMPRMGEQPLMREMLNQLLAQAKPQTSRQASPQIGELEQQQVPGNQLQEPSHPGTVGISSAQSVSFIRQRVGADSKYIDYNEAYEGLLALIPQKETAASETPFFLIKTARKL